MGHVQDLCPPEGGRPAQGLRVGSSSASTLRWSSVCPAGTSRGGRSCHPCIRAHPATLQLGPGGPTSSCSAGPAPARAPGGKRGAGGPAHAPKQQRTRQGRRETLLVLPQQSRNKQTMALCARAQAASSGPGPGLGWLCWDGDIALCGLLAGGPGARSTARPQARASGACPGPGCCLKGCLPGQGGCAGAGHSLHSDGGCSWDAGLPGRKQAGPVLGRRRQSPARPEGRTRPAAAALRRLKSVHVLRCALFG